MASSIKTTGDLREFLVNAMIGVDINARARPRNRDSASPIDTGKRPSAATRAKNARVHPHQSISFGHGTACPSAMRTSPA